MESLYKTPNITREQLDALKENRNLTEEDINLLYETLHPDQSSNALIKDFWVANPSRCISIVYAYFIHFLINNKENITYSIVDLEPDFSDFIIKWKYNNVKHLFILNKDYAEEANVLTDMMLIETNNEVEVIVPSIEDLSTSIEDNIELKRYLHNLGLRKLENVVPENSGTLQVAENTSRFSGAIWFEKIQEKEITLAGLGGIGSYVSFLLSRMNPRKIFLYDDDIVESVNLSGQLYEATQIGTTKVEASADIASRFAMYSSTYAIPEKFTEATETTDIMISGFDNMEARKIFFNSWYSHVQSLPEERRRDCLYIDGRLAAEHLQVLCIRGDDSYNMEVYKEVYLFSHEQADPTVCSYKQTTYMANMIGSIIVNLFANFVANQIIEDLRPLPFFTTYDANIMTLKTKD